MKKGFVFVLLLVACGFLLFFINSSINPELAIKSTIPMADLKVRDVSEKDISLIQLKKLMV